MRPTVSRTSFVYVSCDVPTGETLAEWRRPRRAPRPRPLHRRAVQRLAGRLRLP